MSYTLLRGGAPSIPLVAVRTRWRVAILTFICLFNLPLQHRTLPPHGYLHPRTIHDVDKRPMHKKVIDKKLHRYKIAIISLIP
jgi:hypothetical protein